MSFKDLRKRGKVPVKMSGQDHSNETGTRTPQAASLHIRCVTQVGSKLLNFKSGALLDPPFLPRAIERRTDRRRRSPSALRDVVNRGFSCWPFHSGILTSLE